MSSSTLYFSTVSKCTQLLPTHFQGVTWTHQQWKQLFENINPSYSLINTSNWAVYHSPIHLSLPWTFLGKKKKKTLKHWEPCGAVMLGIMGDRGWSSWAVELLSGEHVADNIAYGSSGWWKWITNKHKSGTLQASAPELPQLRKTIRRRQLHRGGEKKADRKSQVYWDRTAMAPSLHRAHLLLLSLDLCTPTFCSDQSHLSDCPLTKKWHQNIFILRDVTRRARQWVSQGWLAIADTQEDPRIWIRCEPWIRHKNFFLV